MELATVSPDGQVTIPPAILRLVGLKGGDRLLFQERDGEIWLANPARFEQTLATMQALMRGAAEEAGISTDEDVQQLVDEVRYGK